MTPLHCLIPAECSVHATHQGCFAQNLTPSPDFRPFLRDPCLGGVCTLSSMSPAPVGGALARGVGGKAPAWEVASLLGSRAEPLALSPVGETES